MKLTFEWDDKKNAANKKKHGVAFEEAAGVFTDPRRYEVFDGTHSLIEKRWIAIGLSAWNVLTVCFTERNGTIRIISARKASKNDMEAYFYGYDKTSY